MNFSMTGLLEQSATSILNNLMSKERWPAHDEMYRQDRRLPNLNPNKRELGNIVKRGDDNLFWVVDELRLIKDGAQLIDHKMNELSAYLVERAGLRMAASMICAERALEVRTAPIFRQLSGVSAKYDLFGRKITGYVVEHLPNIPIKVTEVYVIGDSSELMSMLGTKIRVIRSRDMKAATRFDMAWHPITLPEKFKNLFALRDSGTSFHHKELINV